MIIQKIIYRKLIAFSSLDRDLTEDTWGGQHYLSEKKKKKKKKTLCVHLSLCHSGSHRIDMNSMARSKRLLKFHATQQNCVTCYFKASI